jgi:NAD(P)-dependent dehydrogenase (short-subunit alcohol dehydrogenase family)
MADMTGQVALVTGGIRGIGRAISERLAARGVTVAAGYSRGKEAADTFVADHPGASVHQGNIGSAEDCERVISEVLDAHGKLDILVNNAGITLDKTVRKMTVEDWDRVIGVNLSGAFYLSRAILQHMLDRGSGRWRPATSPPRWCRPCPRRPSTRSSPRSRSVGSASPTRSPAWSSSSPTRTPGSSPASSTRSTAASTCEDYQPEPHEARISLRSGASNGAGAQQQQTQLKAIGEAHLFVTSKPPHISNCPGG